MPRIYFGGKRLKFNPTTISTNNVTPFYEMFTPLDGESIAFEKNDRIEITLEWETVTASALTQLLNIINISQKTNSKEVPVFYYNDGHLVCGEMVIIAASVTPIAGGINPHLPKPEALYASVSITLTPYNQQLLKGVL